jgi:predicted MPP superfamily phosphohydrolase
MTELYPVFFSCGVLIVLSGLEILFFKRLNRRWWSVRWIRVSSYLLPASGLIFITIWVLGLFALKKTIMILGATLTALDMIMILALLFSLPIAGVFNLIHDKMEKRANRRAEQIANESQNDDVPNSFQPRRRFLRAIAGVVPIAAVSSGFSGVAHAFTDVRVHKVQIHYDDLPPQLDGFKILHISDIHIGYYTWLEDVEYVLNEARQYSPDIILATGDLCDRLDVYGDLLRLLYQFNAPMGAYASIGNHEYFRGFQQVTNIFEKSPVPLLLNNGINLEKNGQPIYLAGADDPRFLARQGDAFFNRTIDLAMLLAPPDAFKILMSHRPLAFDYAAEKGVDLTLAGHTHGAQVGFGGRSAFHPMFPESYLWGLFKKGNSRIYTSSGVGHWFPFRLGCPAEAPILELKRG